MTDKKTIYHFIVVLVVNWASGCSSSRGGLTGVSGTRTSRTSDADTMGKAHANKMQSELGQESPVSTDALANGSDRPQPQPEKATPIDVSISVQQWRGDASYTNCVQIAMNGGEPVRLGCNKDGNLSKSIKLSALSRPSINAVRIIFFTQGNERGTTADGSANRLMRITKNGGNSFNIGYEDKGDGDFNDFIFSITTDGGIALKIENCNKTECSIQ